MLGLLSLVVTVGVCGGIIFADNLKKEQFNARIKKQTDEWERANKNFYNKTVNRSLEMTFEPRVRKVICGSKDKELTNEIKNTWKNWIPEEPMWIQFLDYGLYKTDRETEDMAERTMLIILMANRGYLYSGCTSRVGIRYNCLSSFYQSQSLARSLDKMIKTKGVHEELFFKPDFEDAKSLDYPINTGYTGWIYWKPADQSLY